MPVLQRALDTLRRVYRAATAPPPPRARPRAPAVYGPNPAALPVARRNVEKIRTAAMSGRLRIWALPDLYTEETPEIRRMYRPMLGRALVKSALGKKVLSVCSQEVQVQPEDQDDPRAVAQADFLKYALSRIGSPAAGAKTYNHVGASKLVWDLFLPGLIDGWALGEGVWAPGPVPRGKWKGKRVWCDFHGKDTQGLHPMIDAFKGVEGVKAGAYNAGQVLTGEDFADCVLWVNWPLFESPTGLSDLRSIVRPVWIEDTCWKLRGLHLEQYTGPYLKGAYTTPDVRQALEQALAEARGGGWISFPEGAMVDAIDLSMRGTQDFDLAIESCRREILIGLSGAYLQVLEGQTPGGRGDTEVHQEVSEVFEWYLADAAGKVATHQVAPRLLAENFADPTEPTVTWGAVSVGEMLTQLKLDAGLKEIGLELSKKALYQRYSVQPPADPGDALGGAPPPGPGGEGPGGGGGGGVDLKALGFSEQQPGPPRGAHPERKPRAGNDLLNSSAAALWKRCARHEARLSPHLPAASPERRELAALRQDARGGYRHALGRDLTGEETRAAARRYAKAAGSVAARLDAAGQAKAARRARRLAKLAGRAAVARAFAEAPPEDDRQARAALIAEILGGLYGPDALRLIDQVVDPEEVAGLEKHGEWRSIDHPRGEHGYFIEKNSPEALATAHGKVREVLAGDRTPEGLRKLTEHLSILTVKQLHEIKRHYGLKASGRLKADLARKIAERLPHAGGGKGGAPAGSAPREAAVVPAPAPDLTAVSPENPLFRALHQVDDQFATGAMASVKELRAAMPGVGKGELDAALLELGRRGVLALHRDDFPAEAAARGELPLRVYGGKDARGEDVYFMGVGLRDTPEGQAAARALRAPGAAAPQPGAGPAPAPAMTPPAAPEAPAAGTAKEPWEMTSKEFLRGAGRYRAAKATEHAWQVEAAYKAGKPIPAAVRKEYAVRLAAIDRRKAEGEAASVGAARAEEARQARLADPASSPAAEYLTLAKADRQLTGDLHQAWTRDLHSFGRYVSWDEYLDRELRGRHANAVREALAAGKPLPEAVLRDYPGLAAKAPAATPPQPGAGPAPAPAPFDPATHVPALVDAVRKHGRGANLADLPDVRKELGHLTREQQDAVIHHARQQRLVHGSRYEGRHGVTAEQRAAQHQPPGTRAEEGSGFGDAVGMLSVREDALSGVGSAGKKPPGPKPPSPAAAPAAPLTDDQLAAAVHEAGLRLGDTFGQPYDPSSPSGRGQHKVFLSDLHEALKGRLGGMSLDEFKQKMLDLQQRGKVQLLRDDLANVSSPEGARKSAASEVRHPFADAQFHALNAAHEPPAAAPAPAPAGIARAAAGRAGWSAPRRDRFGRTVVPHENGWQVEETPSGQLSVVNAQTREVRGTFRDPAQALASAESAGRFGTGQTTPERDVAARQAGAQAPPAAPKPKRASKPAPAPAPAPPAAPPAPAAPAGLPRQPRDALEAINLVAQERHGHSDVIPAAEVYDALGVDPARGREALLDLWRQGKVELNGFEADAPPGRASVEVKPAHRQTFPTVATPEQVEAVKTRLGEALARLAPAHPAEGGALVPVWKLRQEVPAPDRAAFDQAANELRQEGRLRMVPLSDQAQATREQLDAGIRMVGGTHFFLQPRGR